MEARNNLTEASALGSQEKALKTSMTQEVDPSATATFLETCMNLLCDLKIVEGFQYLIDKYENKEKTPTEQRIVRKIVKHKARTRCEMRLTAQIGEYEMDKVILDLRSNAIVFPK